MIKLLAFISSCQLGFSALAPLAQTSLTLNQQNSLPKNAKEVQVRQNNQFANSQFRETGYFLKKGAQVRVFWNRPKTKAESEIRLAYGQWGNYTKSGVNNFQKDNTFSYSDFDSADGLVTTIAKTKHDGVLYIADSNFTDLEIAKIEAYDPQLLLTIPTFKAHQTAEPTFFNDVKKTSSPFVELTTNFFIMTILTQRFQKLLAENKIQNLNERLDWFDQTRAAHNRQSNLVGNDPEMNNFPYQVKIHLANPDLGPGRAYTRENALGFNGDEINVLFSEPLENHWILWHEMGHAYQVLDYVANGLTTEVTVNLWALNAQKTFGFANRLQKFSKYSAEHLNSPIETRDFNKPNTVKQEWNWVKVTMFWQLAMAFGDHFYPKLNQLYRDFHQDPNYKRPTDSVKIFDLFVLTTSKLTGYNLFPFFAAWGVKISGDTKAKIQGLKKLEQEIWWNAVDEKTFEHPIVVEEI